MPRQCARSYPIWATNESRVALAGILHSHGFSIQLHISNSPLCSSERWTGLAQASLSHTSITCERSLSVHGQRTLTDTHRMSNPCLSVRQLPGPGVVRNRIYRVTSQENAVMPASQRIYHPRGGVGPRERLLGNCVIARSRHLNIRMNCVCAG